MAANEDDKRRQAEQERAKANGGRAGGGKHAGGNGRDERGDRAGAQPTGRHRKPAKDDPR